MYGVQPEIRPNRGFWERMWDNPFVPIGAVTTAAVLGSGLFAFFKGRQSMSQTMMRFRIVAQGATVVALGLGSLKAGISFVETKNPTYITEAAEQPHNPVANKD